jgi:hypothetical protein
MAKNEDKPDSKKPWFSPKFRRVYVSICGALYGAWIILMTLNGTGVIRIPPEKDNFEGLFGPLWMWTDDPVLRGILMLIFGAIFVFLLPGLLVVGVYVVIVVLALTFVVGIGGFLIAIFGLIVWQLWSASATGKVLAVIIGVGVPVFVIKVVVKKYGERCVTWLTELVVKIFFIKRKMRPTDTIGQGTDTFQSGERALAMPDIKDEEEKLRQQMFSLTHMNPNLPTVPTVSTGYRGWIQEVKKRIELRSVYRTREEELKLIQQINVFWEEILRHKKTITALERIDIEKARAAKLEPVRDDAEIAEAELRATKARDQRERILEAAERRKNPPPSPPSPLTRDEKIAKINQKAANKMKTYEGDPEMQARINRMKEDEIMRVMEEPE